MRTFQQLQRGTILIVVLICILIIAGVSGAIMGTVRIHSDSVNSSWKELKAFELAESAMAQAYAAMRAQSGVNSDTISTVVAQTGIATTAVTWNTSSKTWSSVGGTLPTYSAGNDVGIAKSGGTWGAGDGFMAGPDLPNNVASETGWYAFRLGSQSAGTDEHLYNIQLKWWGSDGIDNNSDGVTDTDAFEVRTYTVRAAGIYQDKYVELESIVTRDPPTPAIDPNNPAAGFLAAISVQVAAGSGAPAGNVNIFNPSAENAIDGHDNATSITGAQAPSSTNDTDGILLAASGASLALSSNNGSGVSGVGGTGSSAMNNSGAFIGDIIDTIADGVKQVATDTSGNPSTDGNSQSLGSPSSLALVYHDYDAHGTLTIGGGSGPGYGILVVDATTVTSDSVLQFSGSNSTWEGIVIVRVKSNLAPSGPNGAVKSVGSGSTPGQIGSVVIYAKQNANFSGGSVMKNNGNRTTQFSLGAVKSALAAFNTAVPPSTQSSVGVPLMWRPIRAPGMTWAQD
jgi:Tfp pilus assembly protein PilX